MKSKIIIELFQDFSSLTGWSMMVIDWTSCYFTSKIQVKYYLTIPIQADLKPLKNQFNPMEKYIPLMNPHVFCLPYTNKQFSLI